VQRDNNNYPRVFNSNNTSKTATVYYNDENKGTVTIRRGNSNSYTITAVDAKIFDSNGVEGDIEIVFNSEYSVWSWSGSGWNGTAVPYTATITVEQLLNSGEAALNFIHQ
jgi:hypothetical protein